MPEFTHRAYFRWQSEDGTREGVGDIPFGTADGCPIDSAGDAIYKALNKQASSDLGTTVQVEIVKVVEEVSHAAD
jgi:hypothetical protein